MNISYNWLKRYIATDLPAEKIAEILTDIGLEVEGFEKIENRERRPSGRCRRRGCDLCRSPRFGPPARHHGGRGSRRAVADRLRRRELPGRIESPLRHGRRGALPRRRRRGVQDQTFEDPRRGVARNALRRRTSWASGLRTTASWSFRPTPPWAWRPGNTCMSRTTT